MFMLKLTLTANQSTTYAKTEVDATISFNIYIRICILSTIIEGDSTHYIHYDYVWQSLGLKANQATTYTNPDTDNAISPLATTIYPDTHVTVEG